MKRIICFSFLILVVGIASAQQQTVAADSTNTALDSKMEVYVRENIPFKVPIPRTFVREADVLWETTVWRLIDLGQRQNHPLFFPVGENRKIGSRVNFFTLLLEAVERGEITAYDPFPVGEEFATANIWTHEQVVTNPGLITEGRESHQQSLATGRDTIIMIPGFNALEERDCMRLMIKEKIYFDSRHSVLRTEVIGIQPWFVFEQAIDGTDEVRLARVPIVWVYYPEIRPLLARHPVYNDFNEAQNISYDDFFIQHRYDGLIIKRGNIYNRRIDQYMMGVNALLEAQRLEDAIFNWEQDLWEY